MANNKASIEFYGADKILKNMDKIKDKAPDLIMEALKSSAEAPKQEMLNFMAQHILTGDTYNSWTEEYEKDKNIIKMNIGFSVRKGGLPAIFLNLGGLRTKPTYFIDNAVNNNLSKIKAKQIETLNDLFKEL